MARRHGAAKSFREMRDRRRRLAAEAREAAQPRPASGGLVARADELEGRAARARGAVAGLHKAQMICSRRPAPLTPPGARMSRRGSASRSSTRRSSGPPRAGAARPAAAGRADAGERGSPLQRLSLARATDAALSPPSRESDGDAGGPPPPALSFAGRAASAGVGAPPRGRRRVIRCRGLGIQGPPRLARARETDAVLTAAVRLAEATVAYADRRASRAPAVPLRPAAPLRADADAYFDVGLGIQSEPSARARARN